MRTSSQQTPHQGTRLRCPPIGGNLTTCFSITARQDRAVRAAIAGIDPDAWTAIKYTDAVFDTDQQRRISTAEGAEVDYTAFTSRPKADHVTARLIVRRVPDLNPAHQDELFTVYQHHAVFTNSPLSMLAGVGSWRAHWIAPGSGPESSGPSGIDPAGRTWRFVVCE